MNSLQEPKSRDSQLSECAGDPILRTLWERFDISLLLTLKSVWHDETNRSFVLVTMFSLCCGSHFKLIFGCPNDRSGKKDSLKHMFKSRKRAQFTMSRFFTDPFALKTFGKKQVECLQQDEQTQLQEGDVVNLDDTFCANLYAK